MKYAQLGTSGISVSNLCVGTSPLGGMPQTYGYDVAADAAVATLQRVLDTDITFIDTSNNYGNGESERRIGAALRVAGELPDGLIIASKADPASGSTEFTGDRVFASFRESTDRLGLDYLPVFYLHDPENYDFPYLMAPGGAVDAIRELHRRGLVGQIGIAGGDITLLRRFIDTNLFDVILNHNRYTLLDHSAAPLIEHAAAAGVAFINAAPFASGLLAKPQSENPRYAYRPPSDTILARTEMLRAACERHDLPLAAAALQFSTRNPRITSTVVGVSNPARVDALLQHAATEIPDTLWDELGSLSAQPE